MRNLYSSGAVVLMGTVPVQMFPGFQSRTSALARSHSPISGEDPTITICCPNSSRHFTSRCADRCSLDASSGLFKVNVSWFIHCHRVSVTVAPTSGPKRGEQREKVGNWTQGEKRGRGPMGVECSLAVIGTGGPVR
eukprot:938342-Prorocentrum_minimum.AAC.5